MDVIQAARELGKAMQADERFIRIRMAEDNNDADINLQDQIAAFNLKRTELNTEVQKTDKDQDKIKALDTELKAMYAKIFENKNMREFSAAKEDMEEMLGFINQIINGSASGQDPDTIQYQVACGGDCGGCGGGCH